MFTSWLLTKSVIEVEDRLKMLSRNVRSLFSLRPHVSVDAPTSGSVSPRLVVVPSAIDLSYRLEAH